MAIEFPKLPFAPDSLQPYISQNTIHFHYGKHHKNYVDTLNDLIKDTELDKVSLEEIMRASFKEKKKIYNNAAQAWNHDFMWNCLCKDPPLPSANLVTTLSRNFGSLDDFQTTFLKEAKELFGSGWTWLVKDQKGQLHIRSLSNAENPLQLGEIPLLTCDVWEHAYYIDYQNERDEYLKNFWHVIDWKFVETNLEQPLRQAS